MIDTLTHHFFLLLTRISVALLMLYSRKAKLDKLLEGGDIQFVDPIGLGPTLSLILVVFSEVFVLFGLQ